MGLTLTGANTLSIPSLMFPPLSAALALLPLQRPATPWADDASIVFATPDGKPFPVKLASNLQTKFTEIVAGEPGTGKSVALGALSEAILFSGQSSLPFLSYVDKGFSTGTGQTGARCADRLASELIAARGFQI